jgi:hypothetical protein
VSRWQQVHEQREYMTEVEARAHRAVRQAQKMLPGWRSLVRVLARDQKLAVVLSATASKTDGKTVHIKVPPTLGDTMKHEPELCGQRDEIGKPMCLACYNVEDVNVSIFHEVAHILEDSIEFLSQDDTLRFIKSGLEGLIEDDEKRAKVFAFMEEKLTHPKYGGQYNSAMGVATILNQWLPLLVNVFEDIRVNGRLIQARPGMAKMFRWRFLDVLMHGVEGLDGQVFFPKDKGPDGQLIFSAFFAGSGYDLTPGSDLATLYDEKVVADLNLLEPVMAKCGDMTSVRSAFHLSLEFLIEARKLGYFADEVDPFDIPPPPEQPEEACEEEGDPGEGEGQDEGDGEGESSDKEDSSTGMSGGSGDPTGGSSASGGGQDDQQAPKDDPQNDAGGEDTDQDDQSDEQGSDSGTGDQQDSTQEGGDDERDDRSGDFSPGEDSDQEKSEPNSNGDGDDSSDSDAEGEEGESDGQHAPEAETTGDTPEDIQRMLEKISGHAEPAGTPEEDLNRDGEQVAENLDDNERDLEEMSVLRIAVRQAEYFEGPALNVLGVRVLTDPENQPRDAGGWMTGRDWKLHTPVVIGPEVIGPATRAMRVAFVENKTSHVEGGRRSGPRLDVKTMGRRIPNGNPYIFAKRQTPDRRDHAILIGGDVSGSTWKMTSRGVPLVEDIKAMMLAQTDLCVGTGIKCAVYAHTGSSWVDIYEIKKFSDRWGPEQKELLQRLTSSSANLDGHTLQFYRKQVMKAQATDRTILYFTDGAMPAWNYEEELEVLQAEIKLCAQLGIHLVGVGVGTDSPKHHGLDTIRCDRVGDIPAMITQLKSRLI